MSSFLIQVLPFSVQVLSLLKIKEKKLLQLNQLLSLHSKSREFSPHANTHIREMRYLWAQELKTGTIQSPDKKRLLWCF